MDIELPSAPNEALSENLAAAIRRAVGHLAAGGVVIAPTESSYGMFASALDPKATARIAELKHRPRDQPLPLVIEGAAGFARVVAKPPTDFELKVMTHLWPGPLTLIFGAHPDVPESVHVGTRSVGVRIPDYAITAALVRHAGPLTSTSANVSGFPAATTAAELDERLLAEDVLVVDGGPTPGAPPSTLARILHFGEVVVMREGPVSKRQIETVIRRR